MLAWLRFGPPGSRLLRQLLDTQQRYSRVAMPTKLASFPHPRQCPEPESVATQHSRVIFRIGRERHVFDFTGTVTTLRPQPAEVISIEEKRKARGRKRMPPTDAC
jgi:hypothetical protein